MNTPVLELALAVVVVLGVTAAFALILYTLSAHRRRVALSARLRPEQAAGARPGKQAVRSAMTTVFARMGEALGGLNATGPKIREKLVRAGLRSLSAPSVFLAATLVSAFASAFVFGGIGYMATFGKGPQTAMLVATFAAVYGMGGGYYAPRLWLSRRVKNRQTALLRALPDTLDLLVVCVEAGLGLNQALLRIAQEVVTFSPEMSWELRMVNFEIQTNTPRDVALRNLGVRTGVDEFRSLAAMLIQADRFGTSVGRALRVHAASLRERRRQKAQEAAGAMVIKMVVPLVIFFVPALGIIVVGPAILRAMDALKGVM